MLIDFYGLLRKIDIRYKAVFISSFVFGLLSQGMGLFNKYSVQDDPITYNGFKDSIPLGRWMLAIISNIEMRLFGDEHYSMPTFNGFIGLLFVAITACLIVNILEIRDIFLCAVIAGMMVASPVITCTFGFLYCVPNYMLSMLMGILGVFFLLKKDRWFYWAIGIILIGTSIGIYQAYLPIITTTMLIELIGFVRNNSISDSIKKLSRAAISCALFMLIYFVGMKISLDCTGLKLASYRGLSDVEQVKIVDYLERIMFAYNEFFTPTKGADYYIYLGNILNVYRLVLIIGTVLCFIMLIRLFKEDKLKAIICGFLMALFPLSSNLIFVMVHKSQVYSLMVYATLFPFIFFAWLVYNTEFNKEFWGKSLSVLTATILTLIVIMFSRVDNRCYLKATYCQQEAISYFTTLITHIKSTEGFKDDMKIALVNEGKISDEMFVTGDNRHLSDIVLMPYFDSYGYVNSYSWKSFIWQWCGFNPAKVDAKEFENRDEVKKMPHYPDDGSIKIIDDVIVINF